MMDFLTINFYFIYVCLSVDKQWYYAHVSISAQRGQKKALDPLELELQVVVNCQ